MTLSYFRLAAFVGAVALTSNIAFARSLTLDQVPAPVKRTADTELKNGSVKNVQSLEHNGRTIYEITFADPGRNPKLHIAEDGTVVRTMSEKAGAQPLGTKYSELPAAVQNSIRQYAPNAEIADIDKETRSGRTVYEVQFKEPGKNPKMHFAEDGTLLLSE